MGSDDGCCLWDYEVLHRICLTNIYQRVDRITTTLNSGVNQRYEDENNNGKLNNDDKNNNVSVYDTDKKVI